jgi:hypothetical protein
MNMCVYFEMLSLLIDAFDWGNIRWKCNKYGFMCMAWDKVVNWAGEGKNGWYLYGGQCMP